MRTRLATSEDKEGILRLVDEFNMLLKPGEKASPAAGEIYDEIISRTDTLLFVAESESEIVGYASLYLLPNIRHGWHRGHVEDFFVTDSMRGKHIGTKLFDFLKEYCRNNDIKVIKLDSGNTLIPAHRFYEKMGGQTTERFFRFDV